MRHPIFYGQKYAVPAKTSNDYLSNRFPPFLIYMLCQIRSIVNVPFSLDLIESCIVLTGSCPASKCISISLQAAIIVILVVIILLVVLLVKNKPKKGKFRQSLMATWLAIRSTRV